jgi:hypothetical protein
MKLNLLRLLPIVLLLLSLTEIMYAQSHVISTGQELNAVQVTVPFLTIAPDSRSGAMGDAGVATSPDISSQHWNPAKYAFIPSEGGVAVSYTPWLRKLINDINLAYLVGFKRFGDKQVVSASLRYFSLGMIVFTDFEGTPQGQFSPNEFAIDAGYSRLLTDNLSGAIAFRFIRSDLTGGYFVGGTAQSNPGVAFAGDLAFYYQKDITIADKNSRMVFGTNISNMGNKIAYTESQDKAFIPINLRLGGALTTWIDDYNSLTITADLNKLLVPTPPIYATDSIGNTLIDDNGDKIIAFGKDPNVSVPLGMIRSFWDAPGVPMDDGTRSVFREEMHEITYSIGIEYWYREQFAIRGGYFNEHETKGNRKFFTAGVGIRLNVFGLDFSYLIPVKQNNPLANTIRFTLAFEFDKSKK